MAQKSVKLNRRLAYSIKHKKVVILTARNRDWEQKSTLIMLRKHEIEFEEIIMCPRLKLTMDWKRAELKKIEDKYGSYYWIDDMNRYTY